ncbi:MAG: O-antigen ligase family protein, partial [Candidatus Peribacteraceae bacterium]|nr:O-antigen ligase family protein [Candidatus Peribacteraceae bacterium]
MFVSAFRRIASLPWEKISHAVLLAFLMLAVLWHGGRTLEVTWALVGVTWVVWAAEWMRGHPAERRPFPRILLVLLCLFALWVVASFLTSSVRNYGLDEVFRTVSLALLFFWMARQPEDAPIRRRVLKAIAVTALLATGIGVAVYLLQPVGRFTGTFFNMSRHTDYWPNAWAEFALLAWPVVLLFTYRRLPEGGTPVRRAAQTLLQAGPLGLLLASLALSYSRAAALVLLVQLALLALWSVRRRLAWRRHLPFCLGIIVMALMFSSGSNALRARRFPVTSGVDKVLFQTEEGTSSVTERVGFWRHALVLSGEHPLLGWGPGSFRFAEPRLATRFLAVSDHPHNVFLKVALDSGWPAA